MNTKQCSVCGIRLGDSRAKTCRRHVVRKPAFIKLCMDCGKKISGGPNHGAKRCHSCCKIGERNPHFGGTHTPEVKKIIGDAHRNEKNTFWKGDNAGYNTIHEWVRIRKPKPEFCVDCKIKPPRDLANISQKYKRDVNDFEWLCRGCHERKDGRLYNNLLKWTWKGKKHSEETKKKIALSKIGKRRDKNGKWLPKV